MANGNGMRGLLSSPLLNIGAGLLSAAGPSTNPNQVGVGPGLLAGVQQAQSAQAQHLENRTARARLRALADERERREQAGEGVASLVEQLGPRQPTLGESFTASPFVSSDAGPAVGRFGQPASGQPVSQIRQQTQVPGLLSEQQQQVLGTLAQTDPSAALEQVSEQAFADTGRTAQRLRDIEATLGRPLSEQETLQIAGAGSGLDEQLGQLQAMQTQVEIQRQQEAIRRAREERRGRQRDRREERAAVRRDINSQLNMGQEALSLLDDLEGTFGETGLGVDARRTISGAVGTVQSIVGADSEQAGRIQSQLDRLDQLATEFGFDNFDAFNTAISDQKAEMALGKDLALRKSPDANRLAVADRMDIALQQAREEGIEVPNADEIEAAIAAAREQARGTAARSGQGGGREAGQDLPEDVPQGSRRIGRTSSGLPVYETPNGRRVVVE